ncbi:MAG: GtrA family protein [Halobacteriales archaeon]
MTDEPEREGRLAALTSGVRIGQFVSVGALGAVVDTFVLVALAEGLGVLPELATLAGIETAILVMFAANERWTFAGEGAPGRGPLLDRLKRSHLVRAAGSLTQFGVFVLVYRVLFVPLTLGGLGLWRPIAATLGIGGGALAGLDLWLLVAKGTGIGVGMVVNYVFESLFTWRVTQP